MRIPKIKGVIERRILANYRVDPEILARLLPTPFRPIVVNGFGLAGLCLIRLKGIRPAVLPLPFGLSSENAAHRVAVEWEENGVLQRGVYIWRRDTNLWLNALAGGRVFPGEHHLAKFSVTESAERFQISMQSQDQLASLSVDAEKATSLPESSVFSSLGEASAFFQAGALGYSKTSDPTRLHGLELKCHHWSAAALNVTQIQSHFFDDRQRFPEGSITFDCALLMQNIPHEWNAASDLCCSFHATAMI